jgi:ABC-type antimicrobial peptide transport system permease subunit
MSFKAFWLILSRQITQKWGRFLLASGGIMVGIWAISLTASLGFGLSQTIGDAINSQAGMKRVDIRSLDTPNDFSENSKAKAVPRSQMEKDFKDMKEVAAISPVAQINLYIHTNADAEALNCAKLNTTIGPATPAKPTAFTVDDFQKKCTRATLTSLTWNEFYETYKKNIIGQSEAPKPGEIAICFQCGSTDLAKKLNVSKPEDLLNKEITLEFTNTPYYFEQNTPLTFNEVIRTQKVIQTTTPKKFKVVSVIKDTSEENQSFSINPGLTAFVDFSEFENTLSQVNLDFNTDRGGYIGGTLYAQSYNDLNTIISAAKEKGYTAIAALKSLADGLQTGITVLSIFLAGFGLIALIASIFGIINVMTISVLERQKEIGVLKSLGAKDRDIFFIFLLESIFLGFLGWLLGLIAAFLCGKIASAIFDYIYANNESIRSNLQTLGISKFDAVFPWQLLLGTLLLSTLFTALSGIIPALRASKQNPVEVLRAE